MPEAPDSRLLMEAWHTSRGSNRPEELMQRMEAAGQPVSLAQAKQALMHAMDMNFRGEGEGGALEGPWPEHAVNDMIQRHIDEHPERQPVIDEIKRRTLTQPRIQGSAPDKRSSVERTYYHGTNVELAPGDFIEPGKGPATWERAHQQYTPDQVYITHLPGQAEGYAASRVRHHGGEPFVYEVEPHGEPELDPETAGMDPGWRVDYRVPRARVIRRVSSVTPLDKRGSVKQSVPADPEWWSERPRQDEYLYHGTGLDRVPHIMRNGLIPWDHEDNADGSQYGNEFEHDPDDDWLRPRPGHVYLAESVGGAERHALSKNVLDRAVMLRINRNALDPQHINPDEDASGQASGNWTQGNPELADAMEKWENFRANPEEADPQHDWGTHPFDDYEFKSLGDLAEQQGYGDNVQDTHDGISRLRTLAYRGSIPPEAITPLFRGAQGRWLDRSQLPTDHWSHDWAKQQLGDVTPPDNGVYGSTEPQVSYHLTDNPQFALDPEYAPTDNTFAVQDRSGRRGLYTGDPSTWRDAHDYVRPFVAEIEHPPIGKGRWGNENWLPAEQFPHSTVKRVMPFEAWQDETFDKKPYTGLDVREMGPEELASHQQAARDEVVNNRPHMLYVDDDTRCPECTERGELRLTQRPDYADCMSCGKQVPIPHDVYQRTRYEWQPRGASVASSRVAGETLPQQQRRWHTIWDEHGLNEPDAQPLREHLDDGWSVDTHESPASIHAVGRMMNNCWQSTKPEHMEEQAYQGWKYHSLHDDLGIPRAAWYTHNDPWTKDGPRIRQALGTRNAPVDPAHAPRIQAWADQQGVDTDGAFADVPSHLQAQAARTGVGPDDVIAHLRDLHEGLRGRSKGDNDLWWERVERRVRQHPQWERTMLPTSELPDMSMYEPEKDRLADMSTMTGEPPAIVVDHDGLVDGLHRSTLALQRGDTHIPALRPMPDRTEEADALNEQDWRQSMADMGVPLSPSPRTAMAERSGFPELDAAIAEFMQAHPEVNDFREPHNAHGRCEESAQELAAFLKERGFKAYAPADELHAFPGYENAQKSEDVGAADFTYPEHAMVEVYGLYGPNNVNTVTIDFTASQYGFTEFPKVHGGPADRQGSVTSSDNRPYESADHDTHVPASWPEKGLHWRQRWDALPDDDRVWLFHGTDRDTAERMNAEGVSPESKPRSLAREQFESGEPATFQPGAGLGGGLYVGHAPWDVSGYGRGLLAVRVRKGDVGVSPEQANLGATEPSDAIKVNDAIVHTPIPPEDVHLIDTGGRVPGLHTLDQLPGYRISSDKGAYVPSLDELAPLRDDQECHFVAEAIQQRWPHLEQHSGYYLHPERGPGDHSWNVAPDGTIVDMTAAQHDYSRDQMNARGEAPPAAAPTHPEIIPAGHPLQDRYVSHQARPDEAMKLAVQNGECPGCGHVEGEPGQPWIKPFPFPCKSCGETGEANQRQASAQILYHVAPSVARESIRRHGLDASRGVSNTPSFISTKPGQYFWPSADHAWQDVESLGAEDKADIWRVNASGLPLDAEHCQEGGLYCEQPVHPSRMSLVYQGPEGIDDLSSPESGSVTPPDNEHYASYDQYWSDEPSSMLRQAEYMAPEHCLPYREYDWSADNNRDGSEHWNALRDHVAQHGFNEPAFLHYNPTSGKGYFGEGNHRVGIAHELGIPVPVVVYRMHSDDERYKPITEPGKYRYEDARGFSQFGQYETPSRIGLPVVPGPGQRTANILDAPHSGLDPAVWLDPESPEPILKPELRHWLESTIKAALAKHGYDGMDEWLSLVLTGSLTTYQYSVHSDCDISLWVDAPKFPEWSRGEMIGIMIEEFDDVMLPGTTHPVQAFVVASKKLTKDDLYAPGLRSGYDLQTQRWIEPPDRSRVHDVEHEMNGDYTYALEVADKFESLLRYEPEKAVAYYNMIHKRRMRDQTAGKGDFSQANIVYKMLDNRGIFDRLKELGVHIA